MAEETSDPIPSMASPPTEAPSRPATVLAGMTALEDADGHVMTPEEKRVHAERRKAARLDGPAPGGAKLGGVS